MLYSDNEFRKRLKNGCTLFYFYAAEEALVKAPAQKALKAFAAEDPELTTLPGPNPTVEEIVLAAGTISFFGGRRLVYLPLLQPAAYSDKDLGEICGALADSENAVFVLTSVVAERGSRLDLGKREQKLIAACEKLGYCVQLTKPDDRQLLALLRDWAQACGAQFAPGAAEALRERCGRDQFLLQSEVEKLAALADYGTITTAMVEQLATVTLEADTFVMARQVTAGQTAQALQKLNTLLALQNDPLLIAGALIGNYLDIYRLLLARQSRRPLADLARDFGYGKNWSYRLGKVESAAARCTRPQIERCLEVLQRLDLDLKRSRLGGDLLLQKAVCELALAGRGT